MLIKLAPDNLDIKALNRYSMWPFKSKSDFYRRRFWQYDHINDYKNAIADATSMIEIDPKVSGSWSFRASYFSKIGDSIPRSKITRKRFDLSLITNGSMPVEHCNMIKLAILKTQSPIIQKWYT